MKTPRRLFVLLALLIASIGFIGGTAAVAAIDADQRTIDAKVTVAAEPVVAEIRVDVSTPPGDVAQELDAVSDRVTGGDLDRVPGGCFFACSYSSYLNAWACTYKSECATKKLLAAYNGYYVNCWYRYG